MTPWAPVSLALLFDLRVRPLSWAERGVLHHIHLIAAASPDGITAAIEKRTGEADAAAWKRALGEDGASHLGRLVEAGWFTICPEGVRLAARSASDAPRAPVGPPPKAPDTTATDPAEGARTTPPEAGARLRKLRYAFNHRLGEFAGIDPATTWEVWSASECGRDTITRRVTNPPTTRERNASGTFQGRSVDATERLGNVPGTPRNATERTTERPRNGSRASENALKEEKKREEPRNATERSVDTTERATERSGVPNDIDPAEVLARMRKASGGIVADGIGAGASELVAVKRALGVMIERGATLDEIIKSTKHLDHGHWTQKARRSAVTAGRLVEEREGRSSILGELIAEARVCERCNPPTRSMELPPPVFLPGFKPTKRGA